MKYLQADLKEILHFDTFSIDNIIDWNILESQRVSVASAHFSIAFSIF